MNDSETKFYRYEWKEYASLGFDGDYIMSSLPNPKVSCITYDLIKETDKGYWIGHKGVYNYKKWIPKVSKKRYAYPTKEEAIKNFILRTKRRVEILEHQIGCCNIALSHAEYINKNL